jgi:vacuolar-type H+-ATPase subunit C/Vma6
VTTVWSDLDVRARGLAGRLLGRARLDALARVQDLRALAAELERAGYERVTSEPSSEGLDRAVRRTIASRLRVLERWAGGRAASLAVLFEEQETRNLRALLRGALVNAPSASRVAGAIPTPLLPEGALAELARLRSVREVGALLLLWGHPYAPAIAEETQHAEPSMFRIEAQLHARYAERAITRARDRALRAFVQQTIDLENAFAVIELAIERSDVRSFVAGGARVERARFEAAATAHDAATATRVIAECFAGTDLREVFRRHVDDPGALEDAALATRIAEQSRAARSDPLGPAPLLAYVLRLRAEAADVRRIIAGVALGAPAAALQSQLVTA